MNRGAADLLLPVARFGLAHSFFGLLYEAVVDVPALLTRQPLPSLNSPGSPTRYFVATAVVSRAALLGAVAARWTSTPRRSPLTVAVLATVSEAAATAYLVREVNPRLFVAGVPLNATDRRLLLRRWHRVNYFRLAVSPIAWAALREARTSAPT